MTPDPSCLTDLACRLEDPVPDDLSDREPFEPPFDWEDDPDA